MQAAIQHLIDDGTYQKIVTKWGLEDAAIKRSPINPTDCAEVCSLGHSTQWRSGSSRSAIPGPGRERARMLIAAGVFYSVATNPAFEWPVVANTCWTGRS